MVYPYDHYVILYDMIQVFVQGGILHLETFFPLGIITLPVAKEGNRQ